MDSLYQDIRYAVRGLARSPGFTLVAVLCLGLGIGANTATFSVVNAALIRTLPVPEPERLVRLYTSEWSAHGVSDRLFGRSSYPDFVDLRARTGELFSGLAGYSGNSLRLGRGGEVEVVNGLFATGEYFSVLGVRPALGRFFLPEDDRAAGAGAVAVLSHAFWTRHFGADPAVLGTTVTLDRVPVTIVGVTPERFKGSTMERPADVYVPMSMIDATRPGSQRLRKRGSRWMDVVGRLRPGVTLDRARMAVSAVGRQLGDEYPQESANRAHTLTPAARLIGAAERQSPVLTAFAGLMAVTGLVLLIACANVANLMLARAARRGREIAIRLSLGAGRARVVRLLLVESVLLGALGGGVGLLLTLWGVELSALLPAMPLDLTPDASVLAFTALASIATGVAFGLAPALQATRPDIVGSLKEGGGQAGYRRSRLRNALVAVQMAFSVILLAATSLLLRSLLELHRANPGFDADRLLVVRPDVGSAGYPAAREREYNELLAERIAALPGVRAVAATQSSPLGGGRARRHVEVLGYQLAPNEDTEVPFATVGAGYFRAAGLPLVRGREFDARERPSPDGGERAPTAVVVNESFARHYWPGVAPDAVVGKRVRLWGAGGPTTEVVGVARDAKYFDVDEAPTPFFYMPASQSGSTQLALIVRTDGDPARSAGAVRALARSADPAVPVTVLTLAQIRWEALKPRQVGSIFLGVFGGLALLLASVGLYGVMSYVVSGRTREIGVRMALGARPADVRRLVVGEGLRVTLTGAAAGLALALAATAALSRVLYGVGPADPVTFLGVPLLLLTVAALASWLPARRAAAVAPSAALRSE
ncbi:MAG TPA: ABC transporter permease [Gemmatimonadaceae bacterium]|nr:ABC transporter permease [Gemmatimonadaceae bacterium]